MILYCNNIEANMVREVEREAMDANMVREVERELEMEEMSKT